MFLCNTYCNLVNATVCYDNIHFEMQNYIFIGFAKYKNHQKIFTKCFANVNYQLKLVIAQWHFCLSIY